MAAAAATSRPASPQGQEQGAAEADEDANLAQRTAELTVRSQELTASVNRRAVSALVVLADGILGGSTGSERSERAEEAGE